MILVVDDEIDVCQLMADYLEASGQEVLKAYSVPEALKAIKENQFSFIVCDLVLGTGKGESVLSYLRRKGSGHESVPCLLVSGKKAAEDVTLSDSERFLPKPFNEEEFLGAVKETITFEEPKAEIEKKSKNHKSQMHPDLKKLLKS